ncbi:MAG: GTPase HflX [Chloroflexi bacterium]|nr:GTPase HflX [Chloroflexota bacterium]
MARGTISTQIGKEKAFLVGATPRREGRAWRLEDSMQELAQLALTAGMEVVGQTEQYLDAINPATYIGQGKVEELELWRRELAYEVLVFDDELSPRQQRNLEEAFDETVKVLDRTALILDIFAQHARTREGALQVELAQYEYRLPRLTRAWTHLARQAGGAAGRGGAGGVGLRGPGETQLEVDRRAVRERIAHLKRELEDVRGQRRMHREHRQDVGVATVALVGYTNAGKSTLFNAVSGAGVLAEDKLFATLDPITRRVSLPSGREVLFTDTVGFIQKLPTQLVAAFRATLEQVAESDILLHVIDAGHENAREQARTVHQVLAELGAQSTPVINALNKIDLLPPGEASRLDGWPAALADVPISARTGQGVERLLEAVDDALAQSMCPAEMLIPYGASDMAVLFRQRGYIETEEYLETGNLIRGKLPRRLMPLFERFAVSGSRRAKQSS